MAGISKFAASVKRPRQPDTTFKNKYEMINWLHDKKKQGVIREWGVCGEASKVIPFISYGSEFCNILQTRVGNKFEAMLK